MLVTQSWPALHDLLDDSLPGFSIRGIFQARILEWVAIPFSSGSFWPRDWTCVSCSGRQIIYHWATWEIQISWWMNPSDWNKFTVRLYLHKGVWKMQFTCVQPFLLEAIEEEAEWVHPKCLGQHPVRDRTHNWAPAAQIASKSCCNNNGQIRCIFPFTLLHLLLQAEGARNRT